MEEYKNLIELITDKTVFIGIDKDTFIECENDEGSEKQTSKPLEETMRKFKTTNGEKTICEIRAGIIVLNDKGMLDALIYVYEMHYYSIWREENILIVYGYENIVLLNLETNNCKEITTR